MTIIIVTMMSVQRTDHSNTTLILFSLFDYFCHSD